MIYFSFIFTMIILLIRARFSSIGVDNSYQFEETYLSYLLNEIVCKFVEQNHGQVKCGIIYRVKVSEKIYIKVIVG